VKDIVEDFGDNWKLIKVEEHTTVSQVLQIMNENHIISVPVEKSNGNGILGIVDMLDLITFCTAKFSSVSLLAEDSYRQMEEFSQKPVKHLLDISGRNHYVALSYTASLNELLTTLSNSHRVVVINENKKVIGMITQSKMIEFLYKRRSNWTDIMHQRVQNLQKSVESINMKEFVIEAFKRIWEKQISGLAVVNDEGILVGNISASDLLRTHTSPSGEIIHDLYQPIKKFLNIRKDMKDRVMMMDLPECKPIAVSSMDTLETSLIKCLDSHIHRVFIQDNKGKPVGVISLSDIIRQFVVTL